MTVPDSSFSVTDVLNLVGGKRMLEVMNCRTQTNSEMTLRDWEEWFTNVNRDDTKLNVISLEFSKTRLDREVTAPRLVRQIGIVALSHSRAITAHVAKHSGKHSGHAKTTNMADFQSDCDLAATAKH